MSLLSHQVYDAVQAGDPSAIAHLLASSPNGLSPRETARLGASSVAMSFSIAQLCVLYKNTTLIRALIEHPALGLTIDDLCHRQAHPAFSSSATPAANGEGTRGRSVFASLAYISAESGFAEGLKLALELEPDHSDLVLCARSLREPLHRYVLKQILTKAPVEDIQDYISCARLLRLHGAPTGTQNASLLPELFFSRPWRSEIQDEMVAMVGEYHDAGMVDLDGPLMSIGAVYGFSPLGAALKNACRGGVRSLILLGCDTQKFLASHPDAKGDLLTFVRSYPHASDVMEPLVAEVKRALMDRRLVAESNVAAGNAPEPRSRNRFI